MEGAEAVIHLAGIPSISHRFIRSLRSTCKGPTNALEQAVDHGVKHFLYMSSIMAYGFGRNAAPQYLPVDEAHPALTYDTCGVSKLLGESLCKAFSEKHWLRTLCFRLTHFTALSRPYPDVFPYRENEGAEALHQYIESRDLVALLEAALSRPRSRTTYSRRPLPIPATCSRHALSFPSTIRRRNCGTRIYT